MISSKQKKNEIIKVPKTINSKKEIIKYLLLYRFEFIMMIDDKNIL